MISCWADYLMKIIIAFFPLMQATHLKRTVKDQQTKGIYYVSCRRCQLNICLIIIYLKERNKKPRTFGKKQTWVVQSLEVLKTPRVSEIVNSFLNGWLFPYWVFIQKYIAYHLFFHSQQGICKMWSMEQIQPFTCFFFLNEIVLRYRSTFSLACCLCLLLHDRR